MTVEKAIEEVRFNMSHIGLGARAARRVKEAKEMAIKALEKQIMKKPIRKEMPYSEYHGFNEEWRCPTCGAYVGYYTEGMSEPEQMEYCNECGQHIARDWSGDE